jgi:hypothetical protein
MKQNKTLLVKKLVIQTEDARNWVLRRKRLHGVFGRLIFLQSSLIGVAFFARQLAGTDEEEFLAFH